MVARIAPTPGLRTLGLVALGACIPAAAAAHPHVFIDTGIEVIFDADARVEAVQVVWVYDEFYTMLALDDYGMDPDFTGTVTDAERAELAVIYSNWEPGFNGDLRPLLDGRELPLGGPTRIVADVQDQRLVIAHRRVFDSPVALDGGRELVLRVYDPTYFTAYTIAGDPVVTGRDGCTAEVWGPDWEAADARLQAALDELLAQGAGMVEIEADFPAVGADFAEEVRLTCAGPA
ncbi:MAG: DUF1007 family protein [Alkalilacustris sp.]